MGLVRIKGLQPAQIDRQQRQAQVIKQHIGLGKGLGPLPGGTDQGQGQTPVQVQWQGAAQGCSCQGLGRQLRWTGAREGQTQFWALPRRRQGLQLLAPGLEQTGLPTLKPFELID